MRRDSEKRFHGLDALRGIAALAVVFCHIVFLGNFSSPPGVRSIAANLTLAVPMFFALSAFALSHTYKGRLGNWRQVKSYAIRRFFRIAPLFYLMIAPSIAFRWAAWNVTPTPDAVWLNLTFLFGASSEYYESLVSAGWSIGVEMIFYATLPLVLYWVRNLRTGLIFSVFGLIAGYAIDSIVLDDPYRRLNFVANAANFGFGLLAYFAYLEMADRDKAMKKQISAVCLGAGCAIWTLAFLYADYFGSVSQSYAWRYLVSAAFPLFILSLALHEWAVITNRATKWLGKVSYSIYLTHALILHAVLLEKRSLLFGYPPYSWQALLTMVVVVVPIVLASAFVTFKWVERPGNDFGKALADRRSILVSAG